MKDRMQTAEIQYSCPTCDLPMGIADVSLGENFCLVFGCYCFKCKENFNYAFTLTYFSNEMKKLYAQEATKLRPPLKAIAAPVFTAQDLNFLTALKICDTV